MSLHRGALLRSFGPLQARIAVQPLSCRTSSVQVRVQLAHRQLKTPLTATIILRGHQSRWMSSSGSPKDREGPKEQQATPRQSLGNVFAAAFRGSFSNLFTAFRGQNLRTLYRQNPEELVLALLLLAGMVVIIGYTVRLYFTYFYSEQFTRFPEPVAKSLRRALYYSNYSPDPPRALKYYKQALEQCEEAGLDHFSEEVMGIKIQLGSWLEKIHNYKTAIKVYETLLSDCKRWVAALDLSAKDENLPRTLVSTNQSNGRGIEQGDSVDTKGVDSDETIWGKRTRVLGRSVGIGVKLGELYSDEHVLEAERAHEHLVSSVETLMGELRRRRTQAPRPGEGQWMDAEAIGGALEALGHSYETRSQFDLALPLFYQALQICQDPCHISVLMNNLAVTFAQHPDQALVTELSWGISPGAPQTDGASPQRHRATHLENARRWAKNAYDHATAVGSEARNEECDEACAVALCNLGDVASLLADFPEARRRFQQAIEFSKKIGFEAGVSQAEAGLQRLVPAK